MPQLENIFRASDAHQHGGECIEAAAIIFHMVVAFVKQCRFFSFREVRNDGCIGPAVLNKFITADTGIFAEGGH